MACLWLVCSAGALQAAVSVTDDAGRQVTLAEPARRIVSLAPHVTENLFAIGAGGAVVGTSEYSDYPGAAAGIPRVGGAGGWDWEAIVRLRPDLVVAWGTGLGQARLDRLSRLGIPLYVSEPHRMDDIASELERFGVLTGKSAQARAVAQELRGRVARLRERYADAVPVSVFYEVWHQPLTTVNGTHLISHVIELCGGDNIFAGLGTLVPTVGLEAVLARDPQAIVTSGDEALKPGWRDGWRRWKTLRAVGGDHLYMLPWDLISRHSGRMVDGAELFCGVLDRVRSVSRQ